MLELIITKRKRGKRKMTDEQNKGERQTKGIRLEDALKKYPKKMEIADVIESIKGLRKVESRFGYTVIEEVAPFETENFRGAAYHALSDEHDIERDCTVRFTISAMYFKKGETKLIRLPPKAYFYDATSEDYNDSGINTLYVEALPQDKLEIKIIGVRPDHDKSPKPPYNRAFLADLNKAEFEEG